MSKYIILQCEHNLGDCVNFWKIQLTEYGLCVVYGGMEENTEGMKDMYINKSLR